jgi:hypothetical protein
MKHASVRLILTALLAAALPAAAHEGPPFPVLVDERLGPYLVSVWTDPDIGTGEVYVILEGADGKPLPEPTHVEVGVQPVSGRLPEALYTARPQPVRRGARHYTEVAFDSGGMWHLRVAVSGPAGGGEHTVQVEPTPDGTIGPIGLVVYLLPFLAVGFLWSKAALHGRKRPRPGRA